MNREFLIAFRSILIQALCLIDDALGITPRTIPTKSERRLIRRRVQVVIPEQDEPVAYTEPV